MSNITIPNLPAVTSLSGAELVLGVQSNSSVKITTSQIATYANSLLTYVSSLSFGSTGLTPSIGTSGAIIVSGTLNVANGGTGVTSSTGSGSLVLNNSPTLVTPNLGTPSAINLANATGLPASSITGTLGTGNGGTGLTGFTAANNAIYSTSSSALTAGTLPVLAGGTGVTTSTGSGSNVLSTSPTLVTPTLGAATATSINGATITTTTGTLTLANGSTLATSGAYSVTLTAGANTNVTMPASGYVITSVSQLGANPVTGTPNSGTFLRGDGTWATVAGAGTVTSVGQTFTGGLISVSGSPVTGAGTLALTVAGTSGGIPYFSSASTWASSAVLAANAIVIGGGAGATPATTTTGAGVLTAIGNAVNTAGGLATSAVTSLSSLATVGTITSGTWNGTVIGSTYGGTGVNNGSNTITLGGNLTLSGAFPTTLAVTASTSLTLPTSGYVISSATNFTNPVTGTPSATTYLRGDGTWSAAGTVTSVGFTGGIISVATPTTTPAFTVAGTSGGIPYFSSASTWATSGVLTANALVIGGGAGVAPSTTSTGTGVLTAIGNAVNTAGGLATSAVTSLSALSTVGTITSGIWNASAIPVAYGGTGASTAAAAASNLSVLPLSGGTLTGGLTGTTATFSNSVSITTTNQPLTITDTGGSGDTIKMVGNGATTPNKFIRIYNGNLEIVNSAYTSVPFQLTDSGAVAITGGLTGVSASLSSNVTTPLIVSTTGNNLIYQAGSGATVSYINFKNGSATTVGYVYGDGTYFGFLNTGGTGYTIKTDNSGNFTATGNVTAYSDERVKTNWRPFAFDVIKDLSCVKSGVFERTDIEATQVGVSAQSLREVLPNAVMEDNDGNLSVAYGNAAMVSVIELCKEVVRLRARLQAVENRPACRCAN